MVDRTDDEHVVVIAAPPARARETSGRWARLLPPAGLLIGVAVMIALGASGGFGQHGVTSLMFPVMMVGSTLASLAYTSGASRRGGVDRERDDYLGHLHRMAEVLDAHADAQRADALLRHPATDELWAAVGSESMWRSGPVRIGLGDGAPNHRPVRGEPRQADEVPDPVGEAALAAVLGRHRVLAGMPVVVDVLAHRVTAVAGTASQARAFLRNVLCRSAVTHGPDALSVTAVVTAMTAAQWDWIKWLPHVRQPTVYRDLTVAVAARQSGTHLLVVIDGPGPDLPTLPPEVSVLTVGPCDGADITVRLEAEGAWWGTLGVAQPDLMSMAHAWACARRLAQHRGAPARRRGTEWPDLMDGRPEGGALCVPLGVTDHGEPVSLDIREAAAGGMGPHGLCIGATGSGKSELLKTIALGMVAANSSEDLNLILVDFKGGAAFLGLERAPHVSAVITNLADESYLVDRMQDALAGEITRRQRLLREAGNLSSVADYARARAEGAALQPLPSLLVIVDEFAELLTHHPEFIDTFGAIGRLGRSLGVHLLLASQRLDEGRLRGLESHLSFRICLKTLSAAESRAVLGVADAYELPRSPGNGFLKVGAAEPIRFAAAHVSGPVRPPDRQPDEIGSAPALFTTSVAEGVTPPSADRYPRSVLDAALDGVAGRGAPAHQVWLTPLERSPSLDAVLAQMPAADLRVPVGVVDRVFDQRRVPLVVDLSGSAGNVAVIGAPQSGKSCTLRTLATALAATHSPGRIQLYCLDFGGGGLAPLRALPHVGVVAGRRDTELAARTVAELSALVRRREVLFARAGADSMAEYQRRRPQEPDDDPYGDVLLIVDGWGSLRQDNEALEASITALAAEGLSVGVHVAIGATRWADLRPVLRDQIGTRIELRLADPLDSEIDRRAARGVPIGRPGRGLADDGMPLTVALPRLDGGECPTGLTEAAQWAGTRLAARHPGVRAPAVRVLPSLVAFEELEDRTESIDTTITLGIDETRLSRVSLDFDEQPHLLILGDPGSGKTAALRTVVRQLPATADVVVVDPRRTLDPPRVVRHAGTGAQVTAVIDDLLPELHRRIGAGHFAHRVFLVVDDYHLIAAGDPFAALLAVLPHARDIGLHMVIARRSAGAGRALYEPVLAAVRDGDAAGLQLSTGTDEGPTLAAGRARVLPPGRGVLVTRSGGQRIIQTAWSGA